MAGDERGFLAGPKFRGRFAVSAQRAAAVALGAAAAAQRAAGRSQGKGLIVSDSLFSHSKISSFRMRCWIRFPHSSSAMFDLFLVFRVRESCFLIHQVQCLIVSHLFYLFENPVSSHSCGV